MGEGEPPLEVLVGLHADVSGDPVQLEGHLGLPLCGARGEGQSRAPRQTKPPEGIFGVTGEKRIKTLNMSSGGGNRTPLSQDGEHTDHSRLRNHPPPSPCVFEPYLLE